MKLIDANEIRYRDMSDGQVPDGVWYTFLDDIKKIPIIKAIPIDWMKNKREELEKEYYDLFHVYTDEGRNNQVQLLNDFYAFDIVLRYWEKENADTN